MLLAAKTVAPSSTSLPPWRDLVEEVCAVGAAVIAAPAGVFWPEALATTLRSVCGEPLWVTLGLEDRDPAVLLYSMLTAAQRLAPTIGSATLERLGHYAGLADAWPAIFRTFADELTAMLPAGTVLVLEHADQLESAGATLGVLGGYLLGALTERHPWILIARHDLPGAALPEATVRLTMHRLRLTAAIIEELAAGNGCTLTHKTLRRLEQLLAGRADSLYSVLLMAGRLGAPATTALIEGSNSAEHLLDRIARTVYGMGSSTDHAALDFSRRLGYTHPDLRGADLDYCTPDPAWLVPLAGGWLRLRDVWEAIVPRLLRPGERASADAMRCAADTLTHQDALIPAVELYQELGAHTEAVPVIAAALDRMMCLGQWRTLERWLDRTPPALLHDWPWLVYAHGEIAAAQNDFTLAQHSFRVATTAFHRRSDASGACQSLLAESTVALWNGDRRQATQATQTALTQAETAGLAWQISWAAWQLAHLALDDGNLAEAMVYLERALQSATVADEPHLTALFSRVEVLMSRQRSLNQQREQHRQAYFALEQSEQKLQEQVRELIMRPLALDEHLQTIRPWTATPLMLKLPAPNLAPPTEAGPYFQLWRNLVRTLRFNRSSAPPHPPPVPPAIPLQHFSLTDDGSLVLSEHTAADRAARSIRTPETAFTPAEALPIHLSAQLLGPFRVSLNDVPIVKWPSGRGRAVLKYLLLHHDRATPRDVLMELFWPEAEPDDARNSLNVAMHGLRQAIRSVSDRPIVIFQREAATYRLNPELTIWLDVTEFEQQVTNGLHHESEGRFAAAIACYEQATSLYQGDFLADDPYEDWPMLRREQLRLAYLDMLERLGRMYFSQGQYGACAGLCQQILAHDNCREDAHCRLMRCYSRQGQQHLALRQYQACIKALNDELGVEPLPSTVRLADAIRRHEAV